MLINKDFQNRILYPAKYQLKIRWRYFQEIQHFRKCCHSNLLTEGREKEGIHLEGRIVAPKRYSSLNFQNLWIFYIKPYWWKGLCSWDDTRDWWAWRVPRRDCYSHSGSGKCKRGKEDRGLQMLHCWLWGLRKGRCPRECWWLLEANESNKWISPLKPLEVQSHWHFGFVPLRQNFRMKTSRAVKPWIVLSHWNCVN